MDEHIIMFRIWDGASVSVGDISCAFSKNQPAVENLMENPRTQAIQPDCLTSIMRGDTELFKVLISAPSQCLVYDDGVAIFISGSSESTVKVRYTSDSDWGKVGAKLGLLPGSVIYQSSGAKDGSHINIVDVKDHEDFRRQFAPISPDADDSLPEPTIICRPEHR